jgi:hypothetical protein
MSGIREDYLQEMWKLRTMMQADVLLFDGREEEMTDQEADWLDSLNNRAEAVEGILDGIDDALKSFRAEQARYAMPKAEIQPAPAQKSDTHLLMEDVATHLAGHEVEIEIEDLPLDIMGKCIWSKDPRQAIKIKIDPLVTLEFNLYLDTLLHEIAHARKHSYSESLTDDPDQARKMEMEAERHARYWKWYAKTHSEPMTEAHNVGGKNLTANYFRYQLLTLLNSREAAEITFP